MCKKCRSVIILFICLLSLVSCSDKNEINKKVEVSFISISTHNVTPTPYRLLTTETPVTTGTRIENKEYPMTNNDGLDRLFNKYECAITQKKLKNGLNKKSFKDYYSFRTRILEGSKKEVNFGGHYVIVEWGCGSPCQTGVTIDLINGIIYDLPTSSWGRKYYPDSNLLVVNPPTGETDVEIPDYAYPVYYLWTGKEFKLLYDYTGLQ